MTPQNQEPTPGTVAARAAAAGPGVAAAPAPPTPAADAAGVPATDEPIGGPMTGSDAGDDTREHEVLDGAEVVEHDLEALLARSDERDEYLALAQRTQADFENFRKRAAKERGEAEVRGVARLAKELLPALDNLGRAIEAAEASGDEHTVTGGVKLVHAELLAALARVGIEPFSPAGELFDPAEQEAVAQHPVEGVASGTVVEVYQSGYRLRDAVLRPARVVVAA